MKPKSLNKILDCHPLAHLFIMSAIHKLADEVAKTKGDDYSERGIVDGYAWVEVGKRIQQLLNEGK
jgi:hypothetical protein